MKLQVGAENPALSYAQHRRYRRMMSHALGMVNAAVTVFLLYLQMVMLEWAAKGGTLMMGLTAALLVVCCAPFLYIALKAGQGGHKLCIPPEEVQAYTDPPRGPVRAVHPQRGDDRYWKLGLFYYNKSDPAILVEDRFGVNGGLNYARPWAWVAVAVAAVGIAVTYAIVTAVFLRSL